ncbi:MAG: rhodanese-like domain-containing protein [Oscillospiraceae bacterium]|nr:rhodanese-like domain-containing protein [Oscillospiraceae bacterium]
MRYNREKLLKGVFGVKQKLIAGLAALVILAGCAVKEATYHQISQEEAKRMMDTQNVIILDVREQHEYEASRIPDAVLLPVGTIDEESAAAVIPEKDSVVLVYCRSGNRSKTASSALAELGYTQIYEFGGINTWPYGVMEKLPEVTITSP